MIEIDGSAGEGGGQILRTALALSMVTGQAFRIHSIRAKRPKPGLMRQHLVCAQAAQEICGAQVEGAALNSTALTFVPGTVNAGNYRFAIGSAGSCTLVLQTVLPPLLLADAASTLELSGGTHNPMAPSFHFLERAFAPLLRHTGADLQLSLKRHGFYPAGGGEMQAVIVPAHVETKRPPPPPCPADAGEGVNGEEHLSKQLKPLTLTERGACVEAYVEALAPGIARSVPARELELMGTAMGWSGDQLRHGTTRQNEGPGNALIATLVYEHVTEVFTQHGQRGVSADEVVKRLTQELRDYQKSCAPVGPHLADQLMLLQALAAKDGNAGEFVASEITEHARTNAQTIALFLPVVFEFTRSGAAWQVKSARCV